MTNKERQDKLHYLLSNANLMLQLVEEAEFEDALSGEIAAEIQASAYRLRNIIGRAYERSLGVLPAYSQF